MRTFLEKVLLDSMYDMPSMEYVSYVVLYDAVINCETDPLIIFDGGEQKQIKQDSE